MCRIAGFIDPTLHSSDLIRMRDSMHRGGPDDAGIYHDPSHHLFLGHRRLALIDLSPAGHQPMTDPSGRLHIVYNGEIYNFKELKSELISSGISFYTQSDTEVILQAYLQWGTACFARFNGMFALALYDTSTNKLILARDHAGIKPLYYSIQGDQLCFASEIKAFKALNPAWRERSDWKVYFLAFGHLPEPVTTLDGVMPLPKGSFLEYNLDDKKSTIKKYYHDAHAVYNRNTPDEIFEELRTCLKAAVRRHLISDAPIGLFLSGGIDSSLLTLLAQPQLGDHLKTLSIYFFEEKYSEKKYQDIIIKKTGAHHQSFLVTADTFNAALPDAMQAMDQPTTDGINSYFISNYAHEYGLTAVLSGIGADELFGGYPSIKLSAWKTALQKLPSDILSLSSHAHADRYKKIAYLTQSSSTYDYLFYRGLHDPQSISDILDMDEGEVIHKLDALHPIHWNGETPKEKASDIEYHLYMQNQLLRDADFMSMWHALEIRVPFLDKNVIALARSLPPTLRFSDVKPKYALTEAFKDILPVEIWNRPKQGFTFPFAMWMKESELAKPVNKKEEKYFNMFQSGRMSWSRYWGMRLCEAYH